MRTSGTGRRPAGAAAAAGRAALVAGAPAAARGVARAGAAPRSVAARAGAETAAVKITVQRRVQFGAGFKVVGSDASLGGWDVAQSPAAMRWSEGDVWEVELRWPSETQARGVGWSGGSTRRMMRR